MRRLASLNLNLRRSIAVGLLLAVVLAAAVVAGVPYVQVATERDVAKNLRAEIARLQTNARRSEAPSLAPERDLLLDGATSGLAGAELQRQIQDIARGSGMALRSTRVLPPQSETDHALIRLEVNLQGATPALRSLLYMIETGRPALIVETIDIRSSATPAVAGQATGLEVNLKVLGYGVTRAAK